MRRNFSLGSVVVLIISVVSASIQGCANKDNVSEPKTEKINKEADSSQNYVTDELIVKFKDGVSELRFSEINKEAGTEVKDRLSFSSKTYVLKIISGASVEDTVRAYREYPEVEFAEPNYIVILQ